MDFVLSLLSSAAVGGSVAAALLWITRVWLSERIKGVIKNEYDQKLETHKAQLKAQSDVEMERLRSDLHKASVEHEVRFSKLHEQRASVIAEAYALLKTLYQALVDYVKTFEMSGEPSKAERFNLLCDAHIKFYGSFSSKLIFFPKPTADKLEEINSRLVQAANKFRFTVANGNNPNSTENWIQIEKEVSLTIKEALRDLEDEFRSLLGDKN